MTSNSIRPKFKKKTSMPNSVKSLGYIKCSAWVASDLEDVSNYTEDVSNLFWHSSKLTRNNQKI